MTASWRSCKTAERLLEERSLAEISVDDLAKGAGISRPTFYFYFPSKDAVLMTLLDRVIAEADAEDWTGFAEQLPGGPRTGLARSASRRSSRRSARTARSPGRGCRRGSPTARFASCGRHSCDKWIDNTAALITAERERGAAPDTIPAEISRRRST